MASSIEYHIKNYVANAAIAAYVLVKAHSTAGEVVVAAAGDTPIGITMANAAAGTVVPVRLLNGYGTALVLAGGTIALHGSVSATGSAGKIDDAAEGPPIGIAEESAVTGDVIEVLLGGLTRVASANQTTLTDNTGGSVTNATLADGLTAVAVAGTLTGTTDGTVVDCAATAAGCAGGATPSATNVDTAVAAALAPLVTSVNLQLKEIVTMVNTIITDLGTQNSNDAKIAELANALLAADIVNGVAKGSA